MRERATLAKRLRRTARKQGYRISYRLAYRIVAAAWDEDLHAYQLAALVHQECGFRFVFGHDAGGMFPGERVTKAKYRNLQQGLRAGLSCANGVGYVQATYGPFIIEDDDLWKPKHNLRWGAKLQKQLGTDADGLNKYNGDTTGAYGRSRQDLIAVYQEGMAS